MKHLLFLFAVMLVPSLHAAETSKVEPKLKTKTFILDGFVIDKEFKSMTGPTKRTAVPFAPEDPGKFVWIRSFRVDPVTKDGKPESLEFLCHAWAGIPTFDESGKPGHDLMTISQGMAQMDLPSGYGFKMVNIKDAPVMLLAQALSNQPRKTKLELSYVMTFTYLTGEEGDKQQLKPLYGSTIEVLSKAMPKHHHGGGTMGPPSMQVSSKADPNSCSENGKVINGDMSDHFMVPPGKHTYATQISAKTGFYRNAKIHYIKLHLHPYGESVTLTDKTTGKVVWKGLAVNAKDRPALLKTESYSSNEGLQIFKDHKYELSTIYDNKSKEAVDAMAVLRVYFGAENNALAH